MDEIVQRRMESIEIEANVIIERVKLARMFPNMEPPKHVTDKLNEGAQQIQMDVAALIGIRKEREKENGKSKSG